MADERQPESTATCGFARSGVAAMPRAVYVRCSVVKALPAKQVPKAAQMF